MANPIRRIIQLVLDRVAARKTEQEAKKTLAGIEGGVGSLTRAAKALGGILATVFGIRALVAFGKAAVREALASESAWSELQGTVEATGASFKDVEGDLRGLGAAFQDATVHTDEDYANSLTRLISITGDVSASTNNMGLVANVAAQFFRGDLGPAVDLVSKVMNGNHAILGRMGIRVKSAQEGLEVLARRSFGAAERQAGTFGGKLLRLNVIFGDLREELGDVLVGSGQAAGALDMLSGAVQSLVKWVRDNKDEIRDWVTNGVQVAIGAMQDLLGLVRTFLQLRGSLSLTAGTAPAPLANNAKALKAQLEGFNRQLAQADARRLRIEADMARLEKANPVLKALPGLSPEMVTLHENLRETADELATIERNANAAKIKLRELEAGGTTTPKPRIFGKTPQLAAGAGGEGEPDKRAKAIADALAEFEKSSRQIDTLSKLLGDDFDKAAAKTQALNQVILALSAEGLTEADPRLTRFRDLLREAGLVAAEVVENVPLAGQTMADSMDAIAAKSAVLGTEFDAAAAEAQVLEDKLVELRLKGLTDSDPAYKRYAERLAQVRAGMKQTEKEAKTMAEVAGLAGEVVGASLDGGLGPFARMKAKVNLIRAAEETAEGIAAAFSLFGAVNAPKHFAAAAKFVAIAGAWAAIGGGAGGGAPGGGGGGSGALSGARSASGGVSERTREPMQDIHVHFVGPGFRATNPVVQEVWRGTEQIVRKRYGNNVRIISHPPKEA